MLCDPMDHSLPGSSVHGISQARILEWVAISFSRGSSQSRDQTQVSCSGRQILYHWATWDTNSRVTWVQRVTQEWNRLHFHKLRCHEEWACPKVTSFLAQFLLVAKSSQRRARSALEGHDSWLRQPRIWQRAGRCLKHTQWITFPFPK